jgi:hypothetical protein
MLRMWSDTRALYPPGSWEVREADERLNQLEANLGPRSPCLLDGHLFRQWDSDTQFFTSPTHNLGPLNEAKGTPFFRDGPALAGRLLSRLQVSALRLRIGLSTIFHARY